MSKIRLLNFVLVMALALGMVPAVSGASPAAAPAAAPVAGAESAPAAVPPVQPTQAERIPPHAQEIPAAETDGSVPARLPRSLQEIPSGMVIIELEGEPLAVQYAARKAANQQLSAKQMEQAKAQLEAAQLALKPRLENLGAKIVSNYTTAYNGFLAQIPPDSGAAMLALPGVKAIHRAPEYVPTLGTSVPLIGAPEVWQDLGYKGENMVIAVIDTGIDYTHKALGGSGNPNDYANNDPDVRETGTFPTAKVIEGYDFAGTDYNADSSSASYQPIPTPDHDPLDENGHGTHVSSIATGIAAGQVMTGVAPMAKLMALKVFGAEGSTNLVVDALEMATYHYLLYGWPQIINMSLGSSYGPGNIDDPDVVASNNAVAAGVVVVASAGNSADVPYIVGSPGTADKVIGVAGSTTGYVTGPTIDVQGTTNPTQTNIIYMPPAFSADGHFTQTVTAPLAYVGNYAANAELCSTTISPTTALQGKVALIVRGNCAFVDKVRNAKALGAVGAIIFNSAAGGNTYVTMADDGGDNFIPAGFIARQDGLNLIPANGQTVTVSAENIVRTVMDRYTPVDSVYPASSRGPRGTDSKLKPEVGAPGYNIFAADMGTGVNGVTYSGTSMAAPHVAGVAALIKQAHPDWTPEQVKAALMNTAKDYADNSPIPRVGAGRVDAYRAVDTKVVAVGEPDLVSFSGFFATGANTYVTTRNVTVYNHDTTAHTYNLGWALQSSSLTGVNVAFATPTIVVPAQGTATVPITFTFDTTQIPADFRTQEEIYGYVTLTPPAPYQIYLPLVMRNSTATVAAAAPVQTLDLLFPEDALRIPFSFVPRPYTALTITGDGVIEDPEGDYATYAITQTGPISSSLWVYPTLVTDPLDTGGPGDIKAVGMDFGGTHATYGPILSIALSSWGAAHTAHYYFVEYDLYVDTNEDGVYDYVLYNTPDSSNANYYRVAIYNLSTRTSTLSPFTAYTDYNSGLMEWYVPVSSTMGLNPTTNPDFNFEVVGFEPTADFTDSVADETTPGRFNYAQYLLGWDYTGDPGPGDRNAEVYVWVNSVVGYGYSQPKGVMIVDYPGNPTNGGQVYLRPFSAPITAVDLLHTNDFHGQLEPSGSNPGIARVAYAVNNLRARLGTENVVLLDGGDEMQGSLLSNLKKGEPTIDLFNFLGYQAATFGNHEFDWGQQVLISRTQQAHYPYLAANLVVSDSGSCATAGWTVPAFTRPWMTMTVGTPGKQIVLGLIGVTSQETPYITVASATEGLCFKDAADSIDHYYNDVIAAGAQAIVILSHLGNTDGGYGYGIPVYGDQTLARKLVEKGKPANLIIGAHSHTDLSAAQLISGTTVVQAHYNGRKVGNATLIFDQYNNTLAIRWRRIAINTTAPTDTPTANRLATWTSDPAYQAQINQIIGYTNVPLVRRNTIDNMMGTFVNDAIYNQLNSDTETLNDADMVFNNSGGLRADITGTYPLTLTYGALFTVLPFGNQTIVGDMTGAQIYDLLNQSATLFKGTLQVAGIRFAYYSYGSPTTFDAYHSTWWAWGAYSITVKNRNTGLWEPLVMTKTYRVATNEFLAPAGQDGFTPFKYMTNISYWGDMLNQVIAWVSANHATPATAYNGPNNDGNLDGRILREGDNSSGPIIPVTILHHNDGHGRLLPSGSNPGYTNLVTLIRQEWANNPQRTILLNAGDTIQGDAMAAYYKAAFTGKGADGTTLPITLTTNPIIAAMNAMTYTAMTLGNHEFNYGNYVFTGTLGQAHFPLLQANVYDDGSYGLAQVNVRPFVTTTVGPEGIQVAILGIGNHRIPNYELPSNIPGLTFTNPITETQARAPALKATNDAVVALTHIGFTEDPASIEVDTNVDTNLAAQATGIDAIIGGHSHTNPSTGYGPYKFLPTFVGAPDNTPVIINQAYRYNTYLGEVVLGMRAKAGGGYEVVARAGKYIQVKTDIPEATDIKAIVTPYNDFLQTYRNRTLGQTTVPIDTLNAYTQETNGANLQVDASIWKLNNVFGAGYVNAHLSGAMTNAKIASSATPSTPYTMTVADMFTLMPYENSLVVFRLNGPQLKTILERAYRNYWYYKYGGSSHGGYSYYTTCMLDVSAGSVITYDEDPLTYTVGSDYVVGFSINGNPVDFLDATTYYTISTVNYIAAGSCNFNNSGVTLWPLDQIVQDTQYYVRDVVIEYIPTLSQPIAPAIEGRLVFQ